MEAKCLQSIEYENVLLESNFSFKIMSYNILAYCYVRVPDQDWNAFAYCTDEDVFWKNRVAKIVNKIRLSNADVICLQEVCFESNDGIWCAPQWLINLVLELGNFKFIIQAVSQKEVTKNSERNFRNVGMKVPTGVVTIFNLNIFKEIQPSTHGNSFI